MNRILFIGGALAALMAGCHDGKKEAERIRAIYENGQPEQTELYRLSNGDTVVTGIRHYYGDGALRIEGPVDAAGERHGVWRAWYPDGKRWTEATFEHGVEDGMYTVWQESGALHYQGMMEDGTRTGTWTFYDERGEALRTIDYNH